MYYVFLCLALLLAQPVQAQTTTMPTLPVDVLLAGQDNCTDRVSGQHGICFMFVGSGGLYMVFTQDGQPKILRNVPEPGLPYVTLWTAPGFGEL